MEGRDKELEIWLQQSLFCVEINLENHSFKRNSSFICFVIAIQNVWMVWLCVRRIKAIWTILSSSNIIYLFFDSCLSLIFLFSFRFYFRRKWCNQLFAISKYSAKSFCHLRIDWGIVCFTSCWNPICPRCVSNTSIIKLNIFVHQTDRSWAIGERKLPKNENKEKRSKEGEREKNKKFPLFITN